VSQHRPIIDFNYSSLNSSWHFNPLAFPLASRVYISTSNRILYNYQPEQCTLLSKVKHAYSTVQWPHSMPMKTTQRRPKAPC